MTFTGVPILRLTRGAESVDLHAAGYGIHLDAWSPAVPAYKEGGVWRSSPLSDGRRPVLLRRENAVETLELVVNGHTQDDVYAAIRALRAMLEAAGEYWTQGFQRTPVVLEVRGPQETQTRYAIVYTGTIEQEANPFAQPFFSSFTPLGMDEITLLLERGPWQDVPPGEATALQPETPLQVPVGSAEVYFANRGNLAGVDYIYHYDASTGAFSENLLGIPAPVTLLPDPVGDGDCLYIGRSAWGGVAFPASSLYLPLGTPALYTGAAGVVFEYYGTHMIGPGWVAVNGGSENYLSGYDDTEGLTRSGTLCWNQSEESAGLIRLHQTAINGITGYWVRLRVDLAGGTMTAPVTNGTMASVLNAYVDLPADTEDGELPNLLAFSVRNVSFTENYVPPYRDDDYRIKRTHTERLLVGLRTLSRGANFSPFLYFTDWLEPTTVAPVTIDDATYTAFGDDRTTATGRHVQVTSPAATEDFVARATYTIPAAIAADYVGRYHLYLLGLVHTTDTVYVRVRARGGLGSAYQSAARAVTGSSRVGYDLIDLGPLIIPGLETMGPGATLGGVALTVETRHTVGTDGFVIECLYLLPTDEWAGEFASLSEQHEGWLTPDTLLLLDSTTIPKVPIRASLSTTGVSAAVQGHWQALTPGPLVAPPARTVRAWFLAGCPTYGHGYRPEALHKLAAWKVRRYLGGRGAV